MKIMLMIKFTEMLIIILFVDCYRPFCFQNTFYQNCNWNSCFRRLRKTDKRDYELRYVCPSTRMEELGSHWTYFRLNWHLKIFRKSVYKIQL